ncbi:hypothetical protein HPP92_021674 [Vanilla planifolia]|uniref:Uncharacterized protein n=1 Tax=Vanilla planifolia TaxID=51239 RepID=A0A835UH20_VANPL|nr:hypothetical protein HPP92_021674 [Vanilla planifolia]
MSYIRDKQSRGAWVVVEKLTLDGRGKGKTAGAHRIVKSVNENDSSRAASAAAALVLRAGEKNLFRFPQMVGRRYFSHLEGKRPPMGIPHTTEPQALSGNSLVYIPSSSQGPAAEPYVRNLGPPRP